MTNVMGTVRWVIRVSSLLSKALMSLVDAMVSVGILALRTRVELIDFLPTPESTRVLRGNVS